MSSAINRNHSHKNPVFANTAGCRWCGDTEVSTCLPSDSELELMFSPGRRARRQCAVSGYK